jgi:hypothetical protein
MIHDIFLFYLQNRLIQTSQTGGQLYIDTSPFSIPWLRLPRHNVSSNFHTYTQRERERESEREK